MSTVHAEIEYTNENNENVHSDICPPNCDSKGLSNEEYKKFLHICLDEWLDCSNGSGGFYIKNENHNIIF